MTKGKGGPHAAPSAGGPPTWEKEGRTHIPPGTNPSGLQARPPSFAPSCRLRASPRAFSGLQPRWRPGRNRKEGRKGQNERREADRQREVHEIEHRQQRGANDTRKRIPSCCTRVAGVGLAVPCCCCRCCCCWPSSAGQKGDMTGPSTADRDTSRPGLWPAGWIGFFPTTATTAQRAGGLPRPRPSLCALYDHDLLPLGD